MVVIREEINGFEWHGIKPFFLMDIYYVLNFGAAAVFVIVPFYFETNFILPFVYS
jgi:hypothetical protein